MLLNILLRREDHGTALVTLGSDAPGIGVYGAAWHWKACEVGA